jgi:hypothetical protein
VPPTAIANAVIPLVIIPLAPNQMKVPVMRRERCAAAGICRQMWRPRSLIIQVKRGTFALSDRFVAVLAQ